MVARIVRVEDGSIKEITRTPPITPQGPPAERKIDVRELIARPRSVAPLPHQAAPTAPGLPPGQAGCAGNPEDVSRAERRVVAPNVARFKYADRWVVVEIRGLQPAEIPHSEDGRYLDQVLSGAHTITLANRELKGGDRYEATVCVNGRDVAEHPYLARFRIRQPVSR